LRIEKQKRGFMLVEEIKIGKIYKFRRAQPGATSARLGVGGNRLEHVFYFPSKIVAGKRAGVRPSFRPLGTRA
jgi:hypothetical protein